MYNMDRNAIKIIFKIESMIIMKVYEKSVGAIIYYIDENKNYHYLVQQHVNGNHWAFAKGHVEENETEEETALREIFEETGITEVTLDMKFRETNVYSPKENVEKEVVYFIAKTSKESALTVVNQVVEIQEIVFLPYEEAIDRVTFLNDQVILEKANQYLTAQ